MATLQTAKDFLYGSICFPGHDIYDICLEWLDAVFSGYASSKLDDKELNLAIESELSEEGKEQDLEAEQIVSVILCNI